MTAGRAAVTLEIADLLSSTGEAQTQKIKKDPPSKPETVETPAGLRQNPFMNSTFLVDPQSNAVREYEKNPERVKELQQKMAAGTMTDKERDELNGRIDAAPYLKRVAEMPTASWLTQKDSPKHIAGYLDRMRDTWLLQIRNNPKPNSKVKPPLPALVFVLYYIPDRDLDGHSRGGAANTDEYREFVKEVDQELKAWLAQNGQVFRGISGRDLSISLVVEPDALAHLTSPKATPDLFTTRVQQLGEALAVLDDKRYNVYLDAGHPGWIMNPDDVVTLVHSATQYGEKVKATMPESKGKRRRVNLRGLSLNVASTRRPSTNADYMNAIVKSAARKNLGYTLKGLVDSGRIIPRHLEDQADKTDIFNPRNAALGNMPAVGKNGVNIDACATIKPPGDLDADMDEKKTGEFYYKEAKRLAQVREQVEKAEPPAKNKGR